MIREKWLSLGKYFGGFIGLGVVMTSLIAAMVSERWAFFAAGVWSGATFALWRLVYDLADGSGGRLMQGASGEEYTADELRRLRRHGWRCVHNLHFEMGDVDHVAIGPGGVVVVETKFSTADWRWLVREGSPVGWARQARKGATRVHHLAKQRTGVCVEPVPVVAVWGHGRPEDPQKLSGVTALPGAELQAFMRDLPTVLNSDQIEVIYRSLDAAARDFDQARGVSHPGFVRRLFE